MGAALGGVLGAALGYAWYRLIGCRGGACPITGTAPGAVIYGALVGLLLASR